MGAYIIKIAFLAIVGNILAVRALPVQVTESNNEETSVTSNEFGIDEESSTASAIHPTTIRSTHPMDDPNWLPPRGPWNEREPEFWIKNGQQTVKNQIKKSKLNENIAKNVIIFLGDGMSITTLAATRVYISGENETLSFEKFPYTGLAKTYCINYQVSDSACTATAILTGVKTNYGVVSMSGSVDLMNCTAVKDEHKLDTIIKLAQEQGKSTGLVTTTRITHATPSTIFANAADREWEDDNKTPEGCDDIAKQMIHGEVGKKLNVIMGGGARGFYPNTYVDPNGGQGRRKDGRNLIEEWIEMKNKSSLRAEYVQNKTVLDYVDLDNVDYLLGLFSFEHMDYHLEANPASQPTLKEMTEAALRILKRNTKGYVLFVEGGRIDQAHHANLAKLALDETVEFANSVQFARQTTSEEDTLIIATADHSHTLTMGGYPVRGNNILDVGDFSRYDAMPYFTLNYANGPSYVDHFYETGGRKNPKDMDSHDLRFRFPATVWYEDETHGGDDVAVFASGPWAHIFTGSYEQNYIAHGMFYASCIGPDSYEKASQCSKGHSTYVKGDANILLIPSFSLLALLLTVIHCTTTN